MSELITMALNSSIQTAKSLLRSEIKTHLPNLSLEDKHRQSKSIFEKLRKLPSYQSAASVSVYLSTDNEVDTAHILRDLFVSGKKCFVPRYNGNVMEMVRLLSLEDYDNLPLTKWNIKQPSIKEQREIAPNNGGLDLVILPGVAFTMTGKRLGHGKGYYDTFLHKIVPRPATVALAFREQIREDIPVHQHDFIVDNVISG